MKSICNCDHFASACNRDEQVIAIFRQFDLGRGDIGELQRINLGLRCYDIIDYIIAVPAGPDIGIIAAVALKIVVASASYKDIITVKPDQHIIAAFTVNVIWPVRTVKSIIGNGACHSCVAKDLFQVPMDAICKLKRFNS